MIHVQEKAEQEKELKESARLKQAFETYFSFSDAFFAQNPTSKPISERQDFRIYLIALANVPQVIRLYKILKNALVQDAIYNKDYWHLTDGYLSERADNFALFMQEVDCSAVAFGEIVIDLYNEGKIVDLERFTSFGHSCIKKILAKAETQENISCYQFAEITILKHLDRVLKEILLSYELAEKLTSPN